MAVVCSIPQTCADGATGEQYMNMYLVTDVLA